MLRLGLTGGIASGKSTVCAMLRELGFPVLEADIIAHQVIDPGEVAYDQVVRQFGASIVGADKKVDRAALAKIVFADPELLNKLNAIVHPHVEQRVLAELHQMECDEVALAAFVEAALIIEAGLDQKLDGVVVVWCTPEQQLERLISRGLTEDDARARISAQMPVEEKLRRATYKIDCSRTLAETRRQVEELATKLRQAHPKE